MLHYWSTECVCQSPVTAGEVGAVHFPPAPGAVGRGFPDFDGHLQELHAGVIPTALLHLLRGGLCAVDLRRVAGADAPIEPVIHRAPLGPDSFR